MQEYLALCKLKVVALMLITSWVGMLLATNHMLPIMLLINSTLGIGLTACAAAVLNHILDRHIDKKMQRTRKRPVATGTVTPYKALIFSFILATIGLTLLELFVNSLTAILTCLSLIGYAGIYTLYLKRATPQNIVIGGVAGATPPLLGWTAVTNSIEPFALLLVLIIFAWTPPHFWALAIYRRHDYSKANIPMLPVTHGVKLTKIYILLYTIILFIVSLLPFVTRMNGIVYLIFAVILGIGFLNESYNLLKSKSEYQALKTFKFSGTYLIMLFFGLLIDHYLVI